VPKPRGSHDRTERAILDAAGQLFDAKGFSQTSLQDIANAIGGSRSSIYYYFDNREQILAAGIDELTEARNLLIDSIDLDADPPTRLRRLMSGLGALISSHPVWIRVLLRDEASLPDDSRSRDQASRLAYFALLSKTLSDGSDQGYFLPRDEKATALTIIAALAGLQGHYAATMLAPAPDATQLIVGVLMNGILLPHPERGTLLERGLDMIREGTRLVELSHSSTTTREQDNT